MWVVRNGVQGIDLGYGYVFGRFVIQRIFKIMRLCKIIKRVSVDKEEKRFQIEFWSFLIFSNLGGEEELGKEMKKEFLERQ